MDLLYHDSPPGKYPALSGIKEVEVKMIIISIVSWLLTLVGLVVNTAADVKEATRRAR
jgi:hypothetical protein